LIIAATITGTITQTAPGITQSITATQAIPEDAILASGDAGIKVGATGTSWNPNWARDYGPDVDRARKADAVEVQEAIDVMASAPIPEAVEEAREIAQERSLASELMKDDNRLLIVMTAYYAYVRWRDEEDAILMLMMI